MLGSRRFGRRSREARWHAKRGSELVLAPSSAPPLPVTRTPCGTIIIPMARSLHGTRLRQARLSTTPWESLTPPVARTRALKGIGESQGRSCLVILAGRDGVVTMRLEFGARPGAKMARRRRRRVACGARSAQRRRGRRGAYAGHLQQGGCGVDRCASRIRRGLRHVARAGQLRQVFDACAELAAFLRRAIAEAPHTVLDLAGEAGAAQEPFAPEAMGRAVPSRRRSLGDGLRLAAQDEEVGHGSPASVT